MHGEPEGECTVNSNPHETQARASLGAAAAYGNGPIPEFHAFQGQNEAARAGDFAGFQQREKCNHHGSR